MHSNHSMKKPPAPSEIPCRGTGGGIVEGALPDESFRSGRSGRFDAFPEKLPLNGGAGTAPAGGEETRHRLQTLAAIGVLAGGIAHNFNNILSVMIGFGEMALLRSGMEGSPVRTYLEELLDAAGRARELVHRMLSLGRLSEPSAGPVPIRQAVREALRLIRAALPAAIVIREAMESEACVRAGPAQVHGILVQLCIDAAHAMGDGGGRLHVGLHETVTGAESGGLPAGLLDGRYAVLTVTGTGCGMNPQARERISDPLVTTDPEGEAAGLGLPVVRDMLAALGGRVEVHTDGGGGASFRVYFPVVQDAGGKGRGDAEPAPVPSTARILVAEDEPALARALKMMLESGGYHVVAETGSREAFQRFADDGGAFDLIVADMTLPEVGGRSFLERIGDIRLDVPVILCSGYDRQPEDLDAGLSSRRVFLKKPVSRTLLLETVEGLLQAGPSGRKRFCRPVPDPA